MLYSYNANKKANSTTQILTGTVKEVLDDKVVVFVPLGYNKSMELTVDIADLGLAKAPVVGQTIVAIGNENGEGVFEVTDLQKEVAGKTTVLFEYDRCKENKTTKAKTMEHSAFMLFPLTKASQVKIDEANRVVTIPANVAENTTVWVRFNDKSKFNHFDDYTEEGKKRLGIHSYAQMLQKKLEALPEGQILMVPLTNRFEGWDKEAQAPVNLTPQADGDKLTYNLYANGENALGLMLNTAMEVPKSFVFVPRQTATQEEAPADVPADEQFSPEDEMALLAAAMNP